MVFMICSSFSVALAQKKFVWVIKPKYEKATPFVDGIASVRTADSLLFIDQAGTVVKRYSSIDAWGLVEGMSVYILNGKYGFINHQGKLVVTPQFTYAHEFHEGLAAVVTAKGMMGAIDKSGKFIIPPTFFGLHDCTEGLIGAIDNQNKKWGFIDKTGKTVIPFKYDDPTSAPGVLPFSDGLALAILNKKVGYIDKTGKTVIAHQYQDGGDFKNGVARVLRKDDWIYINKTGEIVDEPEVPAKIEEGIDPAGAELFPGLEAVGPVGEGLRAAKHNGKWGYIKPNN